MYNPLLSPYEQISSMEGIVSLIAMDVCNERLLVFVIEGDIETGAIVDMNDPELTFLIPKEYVETGESLAWISLQDYFSPTLIVDVLDIEEDVA